MDEVGDDAEAALTWEALQSVGSDDDAVNALNVDIRTTHAEHVGAGVVHGALDADDHEAFTPLDELPSFAEPVEDNAAATTVGVHSNIDLDQAVAVSDKRGLPLPLPRPSPVAVRSKRKNFSKHLQFLCLERYADHTRIHGKLPDRSECQLLLHQGFAQFVREGGSAAHPRLAYDEFLKLIRNRSGERQRRLRCGNEQTPQRLRGLTPMIHDSASNDGRRGGKRKRMDEYEAKIEQLIEEIDRVRRRPAADVGRERAPQSAAMLETPPTQKATTTSQLDACQTMVDTILRLQQRTLQLQHELQECLACLQDQYHHQEPSSASV